MRAALVNRAPLHALLVIALCLVTGCASTAAPAARGDQSAVPARTTTPKRITAAIKFDPPTLVTKLNPATVAGVDQIEDLVHAGLAIIAEHDTLRPQLAEAVPTVENGLWKVNPDGTMETTWRIKPNGRWQDGTPFTSDDLVFTTTVVSDAAIAVLRDRAYTLISAVEATDPQT